MYPGTGERGRVSGLLFLNLYLRGGRGASFLHIYPGPGEIGRVSELLYPKAVPSKREGPPSYRFLAQGRWGEVLSFSILNLYLLRERSPPSYLFLARGRLGELVSFSILNLYLLRERGLLPTVSWPKREGES